MFFHEDMNVGEKSIYNDKQKREKRSLEGGQMRKQFLIALINATVITVFANVYPFVASGNLGGVLDARTAILLFAIT